jgi:phosphate butyryltransferase
MSFKSIDNLINIARLKGAKTNRLAVVMAEENHVIQAIKKAYEMGLIAPFLIGNKEKIKLIAEKESFNLSEIQIIHANSDIEASHISIGLIKEKKADMIMKGQVSTKILLHEVIKERTGLTNHHILSHLAIFESPYYHKPFGLTDAAVNISPDINEKVSIINNAVKAFHKLGIENPKVAILAAVENVNTKMQATIDAEVLTIKNRTGEIEGCIIEGPLALDLAISKEAALIKKITNQVVGDADILIVPDLNCGNILYKSLSYLGNARLAGTMLGSSCPIILTSRADSEENKLLSIALSISIC